MAAKSMMTSSDEAMDAIAQRSLGKTEQNKIVWDKMSDQSTMVAALGGEFAFVLRHEPGRKYTLIMKDLNGHVIGSKDEKECLIPPPPGYHTHETLLYHLYNQAKNSDFQFRKAIDILDKI